MAKQSLNIGAKPADLLPVKPIEELVKEAMKNIDTPIAPEVKLRISDYWNILMAFFKNKAIGELEGKTSSATILLWVVIVITIICIIMMVIK